MINIDLYKKIRRLHLVDGFSQREVARKLNISRPTVKRYCNGDILPGVKKDYAIQKSEIRLKIEEEILKMLEENKLAPKKQKLNALIIWNKLIENGYIIGESTIRKYVQEMRIDKPEIFIPLEFEPGEAMEFDWGDAYAIIAGVKTRVSIFCAVLPYSYGIYATVFPDKTGTSFYSGHVKAFEFLGGVPLRCIYDNLKSAVLEGSGKDAIKQEKFKKLEAHYAFEGIMCNAYSGWEKGAVENLVSIVRSFAFTPMPKVADYTELQELVEAKCAFYCENHKIKGRPYSIKEMLQEERQYLLPLPATPLDPYEEVRAIVHSDLTVRQNNVKYSVPPEYIGLYVTLKLTPFHIDVYYRGQHIWKHNKALNHNDHQYIPEHYLKILERKPRAINNAVPIKRGIMPTELSEFMNNCKNRDKNHQLVKILLLGMNIDKDKLLWSVKQANITGSPSYQLVCFYLNLSDSESGKISTDITVNTADFSKYDKLIGDDNNEE
jgi:transposase